MGLEINGKGFVKDKVCRESERVASAIQQSRKKSMMMDIKVGEDSAIRRRCL
jgi:hypothetical protein